MTEGNAFYIPDFGYFFRTKPEIAWYEALWIKILEAIAAVWDYRIWFLRDFAIAAVVFMMLYFIWKALKREIINGSGTAANSIKHSAPTIYNNAMNIHIWLNELTEFMENNKISKEQEKQDLDKTSKSIIKGLIEAKHIKSYKELETYLKSFFSNGNVSNTDNVFQFVTRKQQASESLAQYYQTMQELALKAYPTLPNTTVEEFTRDQFIKGLHNPSLRHEMVLAKGES